MNIVSGIILAICFAYAFGQKGQNFALPPGLKLSPRQFADVEEDARLTTTELIEKNGYPAEIHQVETSDGYILEIHRIPFGLQSGPAENKPVVFVQHGILSSSADWIIAGPGKGLGYLLADLGYDVWMGNFRGNTYSRHNKNMSPSKGSFWDFSWHEMGITDLPAMIDYVLVETKQEKLFYIGHSQGTTAFYIMASEKPEYNDKIRAMFSLAPIAFMSHMTSPLVQIIAKAEKFISVILKMLGIYEFLPSNDLMAQAGSTFCDDDDLTQFVCTNSLFVLCGFNRDNLNATLLPVIMGHTPAGASTKQFIHYAQEVNSGKFRKYDYFLKNIFKYGKLTPPNYDLNKVTAPVSLHYSRNDWMSSVTDVLKLSQKLKNPIGRFQVLDGNFNHLDYLWGNNAHEMVYQTVFNLMSQY